MRVLVTGGSRGIGKAIVNEFEKHGHVVYSPTREDIDLSNLFRDSKRTVVLFSLMNSLLFNHFFIKRSRTKHSVLIF